MDRCRIQNNETAVLFLPAMLVCIPACKNSTAVCESYITIQDS